MTFKRPNEADIKLLYDVLVKVSTPEECSALLED